MDLKRPLLRRLEVGQQPFAHLAGGFELPEQAVFEAHSWRTRRVCKSPNRATRLAVDCWRAYLGICRGSCILCRTRKWGNGQVECDPGAAFWPPSHLRAKSRQPTVMST